MCRPPNRGVIVHTEDLEVIEEIKMVIMEDNGEPERETMRRSISLDSLAASQIS